MESGFFCEKCGMIKARCVCNKIGNNGYISTRISKPNVSEFKKMYPDVDEEILLPE